MKNRWSHMILKTFVRPYIYNVPYTYSIRRLSMSGFLLRTTTLRLGCITSIGNVWSIIWLYCFFKKEVHCTYKQMEATYFVIKWSDIILENSVRQYMRELLYLHCVEWLYMYSPVLSMTILLFSCITILDNVISIVWIHQIFREWKLHFFVENWRPRFFETGWNHTVLETRLLRLIPEISYKYSIEWLSVYSPLLSTTITFSCCTIRVKNIFSTMCLHFLKKEDSILCMINRDPCFGE